MVQVSKFCLQVYGVGQCNVLVDACYMTYNINPIFIFLRICRSDNGCNYVRTMVT